MGLDLARSRTGLVPLDDEAQDGQAGRVTQRGQLLSVTLEFGRHRLLLVSRNTPSKRTFEKYGTIKRAGLVMSSS